MHTVINVCELSTTEQELLRAAAENEGVLQAASRAETRGRAIQAGRIRFFSPTDRDVAERYLAALPSLVDLQLLRDGTRKDTFELTNFGWQLVRKLGRSSTA